jgi:hypothetical protein
MNRKQLKIQILLVLSGVILIFLTYFYYPNLGKNKISKDKDQASQLTESKVVNEDENSYFENVEYKGLYDFENPFTLKSKTAYIKNENQDIVYMNQMHVVLHLSDGRVVNIIADEGNYNKVTYDCFFQKNVQATDEETNIYADNLDLIATESYIEVYNNVKLVYPTGTLWADRVNYDFQTKDYKVSMFDDKSVKIKLLK